MRRKYLSIFMAIIMILSLMVSNGSINGATTTEYLVDADFEGDTDGFVGKAAGQIELDLVKNHTGASSLRVFDRVNFWDGAEVDVLANIVDADYTSSLWVYQESGADQEIKLSLNVIDDGAEDWLTLASDTVASGVWTEITGTLPYAVAGTLTKAVIYVEATTPDLEFNVDDIQVSYEKATDDGAADDGAADDGADTTSEYLVDADFEGDTDGFVGKADGKIELDLVKNHTGASSLRVFDRVNFWDGAEVDVLANIVDAEYTSSLWVYQESGADQEIKLSLNVIDDGTEGWLTLASATVTSGEWTEITGTLPYAATGTLTKAVIYVEATTPDLEFNVDDIQVSYEKTTDDGAADDGAADDGADTTSVYLVDADFEGDTDGFVGKADGKIELDLVKNHAGASSLRVFDRVNFWDGAEVDVFANIVDADYTSSLWVYQESGADQEIKLSLNVIDDGTEGWLTLASATVASGEWTEITGTLPYAAVGTLTKAVIYVEATTPDLEFNVDDIQVSYEKAADDGAADDGAADEVIDNGTSPQAFEGVSTSFEDGLAGFTPTTGGEILLLDTEQARTGLQSVKVTNRLNNYEGIKYEYGDQAANGKTYTYSIWVRQDSGETQTIIMTIKKELLSTSYENISSVNVPSGEWTEIKADYSLSFTGALKHLSVYLESPNANLEFYIDDAEIHEKVVEPVSIQDLASMAKAYEPYFKVGVAIPGGSLSNAVETALVNKHFNTITAENDMKPGYVLDNVNRGEVDPSNIDNYFNYAKDNGLQLRGHTLLWHIQTPDWFFKVDFADDGALVSREVMLERMDKYIGDIIGKYDENILYAWDVVNEAIDTSEPDNLRNSFWKQTIGDDYVIKAFESAKKHIGDKDIKLFYNDYSFHQSAKRAAIYDLVVELNDLGLIDGVGIQSHISIDLPSISKFQETLSMFGELGLEIQITELDMNVYRSELQSFETAPDDLLVKQGYRFKELFELFKDNSDIITNVTFWGLTDDKSWLNYYFTPQRNNWPLVFDKNYQAKYAYYGIMDPSQLPIENKPIKANSGTAVVDGLEDSVMEIQQQIEFKKNNTVQATMKALADNQYLYLYSVINDDSVEDSDYLLVMIDEDKSKSASLEPSDLVFKVNRSGDLSVMNTGLMNKAEGIDSEGSMVEDSGIISSVIDNGQTYVVELAIPLSEAVLASRKSIGFDFGINNTEFSKWNDILDKDNISPARFGTLDFGAELKSVTANKQSIVIDAEIESDWDLANEVDVNTYTQNTSGATAKVKVLWDDEFIYVYANVIDPLLSKANTNPWEQDSFEIFIDENNARTLSYEADDVQYRVNYDNEVSISGGPNASTFMSATKLTDDGYIVEAKVPFNIGTPVVGNLLGIDFQINDDQGEGTRAAMSNWNNLGGDGWKSTDNFGVLILAGQVEEEEEEPADNNPSNTGGSNNSGNSNDSSNTDDSNTETTPVDDETEDVVTEDIPEESPTVDPSTDEEAIADEGTPEEILDNSAESELSDESLPETGGVNLISLMGLGLTTVSAGLVLRKKRNK